MHEAVNLIDVKIIVDENVQKYLFKIAIAARFWSLHRLIRPSFFLYVSLNITAYHKMWKRIELKNFNNSENINERDIFSTKVLSTSMNKCLQLLSLCSVRNNKHAVCFLKIDDKIIFVHLCTDPISLYFMFNNINTFLARSPTFSLHIKY